MIAGEGRRGEPSNVVARGELAVVVVGDEDKDMAGNMPWASRSTVSSSRHCSSLDSASAGASGVRLHDLRHSVASHAAMNGVPIPAVSRLLGHTDPRTTLHYAHLGDREIEDAAERVGQSIADTMAGCRTANQE